MGVSASLAKHTVFLVDNVDLAVVAEDVVVRVEVVEVLLFDGLIPLSCCLWVFLKTPRSRSCCTLMCRAA